MNIVLAGQKWFGAEVLRNLMKLENVSVIAVCSPMCEERQDRLTTQANIFGIKVIPSGTLRASTMPEKTHLIVAAHSHDFIGQKTRNRAEFGGIGYHPSLLPIHRGRDAVRWAIRMRERVTGGTVYRLSNRMDGGEILAQQHVFIRPDDVAEELWRRELCPLGIKLLTDVVKRFALSGYQHGEKQDETIATWEPSIDRPPAFRPDLLMIPQKC